MLCEEEVFYSSTGNYVEGNMYSNYETYCVVSQDKKKIYVIDFKVLKRIYQRGNYKEIRHKDQTTYCFLVPLIMLKNEGGIIAEIDY